MTLSINYDDLMRRGKRRLEELQEQASADPKAQAEYNHLWKHYVIVQEAQLEVALSRWELEYHENEVRSSQASLQQSERTISIAHSQIFEEVRRRNIALLAKADLYSLQNRSLNDNGRNASDNYQQSALPIDADGIRTGRGLRAGFVYILRPYHFYTFGAGLEDNEIPDMLTGDPAFLAGYRLGERANERSDYKAYKIGKSQDPGRWMRFQNSAADPLELIAVLQHETHTYHELEECIHKYLDRYRVHHEVFCMPDNDFGNFTESNLWEASILATSWD